MPDALRLLLPNSKPVNAVPPSLGIVCSHPPGNSSETPRPADGRTIPIPLAAAFQSRVNYSPLAPNMSLKRSG